MVVRHVFKHLLLIGLLALTLPCAPAAVAEESVARQWNEELLAAIRRDFARPTVHARNLFHVSAASWDAWAAYDDTAQGWLVRERLAADDPAAARETAISYAAYRILRWRFRASPGAAVTLRALDARLRALGLDPDFEGTTGDSPAALGNRIAAAYLALGESDHANEAEDYANRHYRSVNDPLVMAEPGNPSITDPNRYQPLVLEFFLDQAGNPISSFPEFLSPEWGQVIPFALDPADLEIATRDGFDYWTFHDPGAPPQLGGTGDQRFKDAFAQVVEWSGLLDPARGEWIDISPATNGRGALYPLGVPGHRFNPYTGAPYEPQVVPAGDYFRVLAEFWADGPDSETPPGHWFTIANTVSDHPALERRIGGEGPELDPLEWDVKLHFALGGAMHDAAITAWGVKGKYDYVRPVSAIRHMAGLGQSSDPAGPSYHPDGIPLRPGRIEVITPDSARSGERHAHLVGAHWEHLGKIAVLAWRGPEFIQDPVIDVAGVGWIRAEDWWPYQRPSFVTPPFAGYVSGHSTYSRAAAELLADFTGSAFFPGGLGEFPAPAGEFLVFEDGPSVDIVLQWATYRDAADQSGLSRIYGGIHPSIDDLPGRDMGALVGIDAWRKARNHFDGTALRGMNPRPRLPSSAPAGLAVFSGSWYTPGREGEGWSVLALDEHTALVHWLTFDRSGAPRWLSGAFTLSGNVLAGRLATTVRDADGTPRHDDWGSAAFTFGDCGSLRLELRDDRDPLRSVRRPARRINGLDGLDCSPSGGGDAGSQFRQSGFWANGSDAGDGLVLHMAGAGRGLTYLLAFTPDGAPTWRLGTGALDGDARLDLDLLSASGPGFGDRFDPAALTLSPAGIATLTFTACGEARFAATGVTDQSLAKTATPAPLTCP